MRSDCTGFYLFSLIFGCSAVHFEPALNMISRTLCVCVCAMLVRISSQSDLAPQVYVRVGLVSHQLAMR